MSMRGAPTSAMVSSPSSSWWLSIAVASWRRQRARSSTSVDQSVSSKARRAARDGALDVGGGGVGGHADDLLGGRVDVVVDLAALGLDELAVDVEALFVPHAHWCSFPWLGAAREHRAQCWDTVYGASVAGDRRHVV